MYFVSCKLPPPPPDRNFVSTSWEANVIYEQSHRVGRGRKGKEEEAKLTFLFSSVPLGSYGDSPFRGDGGGRRRKPYDSDWNSFCPNQTPIFPPGLLCYARIMEARSNEGEEGERNAWSRKSKKKRRESLGSLVIPMEKYIYIYVTGVTARFPTPNGAPRSTRLTNVKTCFT